MTLAEHFTGVALGSPWRGLAWLQRQLPAQVQLTAVQATPGLARRAAERGAARIAAAQATRHRPPNEPSALSCSHSAGWGLALAGPARWRLGADLEYLPTLNARVLHLSLAESAYKAGMGQRRFQPEDYHWQAGCRPGEARVWNVQGDSIPAHWVWEDHFLLTACVQAPEHLTELRPPRKSA
ncbi:hypothetical protein [Deinococcus radiophilus]|uniref:Uncharacterized protein n=1 Tax=Deinococcus radiophilus TaxID=32062 RepID=A0A3S0RDY1_9DEIO|nr:hypothetical protein [Deinococcus radiophilus]RTR26004.1 hypothetical protein EJ104_09120 [Deinococcus radiophilus]